MTNTSENQNLKPSVPSQQQRKSFTKGTSSSGRKHNQRKPNKPVKRTAPTKEYISTCCSAPARKPRCGQEVTVTNPETKKPKQEAQGLGKWRCTACGKVTKVRPQAITPKPTEEVSNA